MTMFRWSGQRANAISKARDAEAAIFLLVNYMEDTVAAKDAEYTAISERLAAASSHLRAVTHDLAQTPMPYASGSGHGIVLGDREPSDG
jgi:hypothetical protein